MKDFSYSTSGRVGAHIDTLASWQSDEDHLPILLTGPSGAGKQAAGRKLMEAWARGDEPPLDVSDYTLVMDSTAPSSETDRRYAVHKIRQALSRKALGPRALLLNFTGAGIPAQNAMLKIMEEPPPLTRIVALQDTSSEVLDTIRSRCQIIRFSPLSAAELLQIAEKEGWEIDPLMASYARGSLRRLHWLSQNPGAFQAISKKDTTSLCGIVGSITEDKERGLSAPQAKREWCTMVIPMLPAASILTPAIIESLALLASDYKPEACLAVALLTHPQG